MSHRRCWRGAQRNFAIEGNKAQSERRLTPDTRALGPSRVHQTPIGSSADRSARLLVPPTLASRRCTRSPRKELCQSQISCLSMRPLQATENLPKGGQTLISQSCPRILSKAPSLQKISHAVSANFSGVTVALPVDDDHSNTLRVW